MTTVSEQAQVLEQLDRIVKIFVSSEGKVRPHFFMTGPSGSGKSHLAALLAEMNDIGILEINAAQLTKEGTSGNSLSKALAPLGNKSGKPTICFVDEFDKLFISGNSNSEMAHETTNGVQNEFLKVLESSTTSVFGDYGKYVQISIDKVLFIFAGAFNGEEDVGLDRLRDFGIKTEFLGRVGLVYNLKKMSVESMEVALRNSSLLKNYLRLFPSCEEEAVVKTIMVEVHAQFEKNTLGIRLLNTLLHQYFINDGVLRKEVVEKSTFQQTLEFRKPVEFTGNLAPQ